MNDTDMINDSTDCTTQVHPHQAPQDQTQSQSQAGKQKDYISDLPSDVHDVILSFLNPNERGFVNGIRHASKTFR